MTHDTYHEIPIAKIEVTLPAAQETCNWCGLKKECFHALIFQTGADICTDCVKILAAAIAKAETPQTK